MQERIGSPVSLLASFLSERERCPKLVLVTGGSGVGKTTWCLEFVRQARIASLAPVGLISPAVFQGGIKVAIDLIEVETGERRRLATKREHIVPQQQPGPTTLSWDFDPSVLAWGNRVLNRLDHASLVILDELGPLEFLDNNGLIAGLSLIDNRQYQMACVVIRPGLLLAAQERWPWGVALEISADMLAQRTGEA